MQLTVHFLALAAASLLAIASAELPGAALQVNQRGLNSFAHAGIDRLNQMIPGMRLPDLKGKHHKYHYSFWDIQVASFHIDSPQSSVSLSPPNNARFNVVGISLKIKASFRVKYRHLISVHGKVDASTSGARFTQTLGFTSSAGHPQLAPGACDADLGNVKIHFHGWAHVVQAILKIFGVHIGANFKICPKVAELIAREGNSYLMGIPLQFDMQGKAKGFHLSYALTSNPSATNAFIAVPFTGKFWFDGHGGDAGIPAASGVSLSAGGNEMVCINLDADRVFGSAAYAFQVSPLSSKEIGDDLLSKLPAKVKEFFRCECASKLCIGEIVPEVKDHCKPGDSLKLHARTSVSAKFAFSSAGALTNAEIVLDFIADLPDSARLKLLTVIADVGILIGSSLRVDQWALKGDSKLASSALHLNSTIVGPISSEVLEKMWDIALRIIVEGGLEAVLSNGIPLPAIPKAVPVNPRFIFGQDTLFFCTDLQPHL